MLRTLTPEEVYEGEYSETDKPDGINEKFAYMFALVAANEKQVKACREYIKENCGKEYLAVYDNVWAGNDVKRQERIVELESIENKHSSSEVMQFARQGVLAYENIGQAYCESKGIEVEQEK